MNDLYMPISMFIYEIYEIYMKYIKYITHVLYMKYMIPNLLMCGPLVAGQPFKFNLTVKLKSLAHAMSYCCWSLRPPGSLMVTAPDS